MSPHRDFRALSEKKSSNSVVFNSSAENGNEGTMVSNICSESFTLELSSENSIEVQSSQVPVSDNAKLKLTSSSLDNGTCSNVLPQLKQCQRNISSPLKQLIPISSNESNNHRHLTVSCNKYSSKLKEGSQQVADYIASQIELSKHIGNKLMSSIAQSDLSTEVEVHANCSPSESKVVVQAMPVLDFGSISALQQCIDDSISRKSWSDMNLHSSKTGPRKRSLESMMRSTISKTKTSQVTLKLPVDGMSEDDDFTPSSYSMKKIRRDHSYNCHIQPGRGMKLSNIDYIASEIDNTSSNVLRLTHYVLFGKYGGVNSESSLEQTKKNILLFSGFAFDELSEDYMIKCKSLMRLPYPLLLDMYELLVRQSSVERCIMVKQLLQFCLKPTDGIRPPSKRPVEIYSDTITSELKSRILAGPSAVVKLERLSEEYIERMLKMESRSYCRERSKRYVKPWYVVNGPGHKLKSFPHVVDGVRKARRRIINLLHIFLFGRPGSDEVNRLNILEFNGFLQCDKSFLQRRIGVLNKYKKVELEQICNIFSLHVKRGNKIKKIKKLLFYLQAPSLIMNCKRKAAKSPLQAEKQATQKLRVPVNEVLSNPVKSDIRKLQDFEKVCLNIECAPPSALTELNDLLFIKPCDITEIHDKLLNFTPFQFDENSLEFQFRKTLMHYMGFDIVRKIARLLDIRYWEQYKSEQELTMTVLKFLMEMKQPVEVRKRKNYASRLTKKKMVKTVSPHILMVKKDPNQPYSKQEGNYESSPSGMGSPMCTSSGFSECGGTEDGPNSTVVIQRISESSYSWTDLKNDGPITISNNNSDESLPLHEFVHHPTENQIELTIKEVICSNSLSISLGDLLNKVLHHYPRFNLTYRTDFIKSKALLILQEMQECMVDSTLDTA